MCDVKIFVSYVKQVNNLREKMKFCILVNHQVNPRLSTSNCTTAECLRTLSDFGSITLEIVS